MEAFVEQLFPVPISVGSTGGPEFSTMISETSAGYEYRNALWSQPRHRYDVATGISSMAELMEVKSWHMEMMGRAVGFRFRDPQDFTSAPDGFSDPTPTDQLIGIGGGSVREFQLVKNYHTFVRTIRKPEQGSVLVAVDGESRSFTVDVTTGIVRLSSAPPANSHITAGFIFDVPVRFESDALQVRFDDVNLVSGSIPLVELR